MVGETVSVERDVVLQTVNRIAATIACSEPAVRYWQAKDKMAAHDRAQELFAEWKATTNALLVLQDHRSADDPKMIQAQQAVRDVEQQLQQIPVTIQYQEAKDELNELLQGVLRLMMNRLQEHVPVEPGPRQGCGHGHGGNGCDCGQS